MRDFKSNDARIFMWCCALSVLVLALDIIFYWIASGVLCLFVILLSLRSSKDRDVYFFAVLTSLLLIMSRGLLPSSEKIWHVTIVMIWATAIFGLHLKKTGIIKSSLAAIIDSSLDAIIGKTLTNTVLSWNKAAEDLFGYTQDEMMGRSVTCLIPEERMEGEERLLDEAKKGMVIKHYQTERRHKDGRLIQVSLTLSPIKDSFGNIIGISSIVRDITERLVSERKLKKLNDTITVERNKIRMVLNIEEYLNTIFNIDKLVDFVVDRTSEILEAKRCSLMLVDYNTRELCIKGHKGVDHQFLKGTNVQTKDSIAEIIAREKKPVLVLDIENDERFLRKKNETYQTKSFISAPIKIGGNIVGFINVADKDSKEGNIFTELDLKILCMIVRQVSVAMDNANLHRELTHLSITDPLTHIYNFRYFTQVLDHEIVRLKRHPTRPLCLFMVDVDNFKAYNDTFGHLEGDTLLQMIGRVLRESTRQVDIVCRYAGDEFVIILPEADIDQSFIIAERIKRAIAALPLKWEVTVSIGIAKCSTHDTNRYELIQRANIALSNAKKEGKNLVYSAG